MGEKQVVAVKSAGDRVSCPCPLKLYRLTIVSAPSDQHIDQYGTVSRWSAKASRANIGLTLKKNWLFYTAGNQQAKCYNYGFPLLYMYNLIRL